MERMANFILLKLVIALSAAGSLIRKRRSNEQEENWKLIRQYTEDRLRDAGCEQLAGLIHYGSSNELLWEVIEFAQSAQSRNLINFVKIHKLNKEVDALIEGREYANRN